MFDSEFYPTPNNVLDIMGIEAQDRKVLEPSAGNGNIVDYLYSNGAKEVVSCEKNKDLVEILKSKCKVISNDFLKVEAKEISYIDLIVMNPPFSNADEHILHAYEIAPDGCEIIALCNYKTLSNTYTHTRRELLRKISNNGNSYNLGDVFSDAERTTGVEIGLVKLNKPISNKDFDYSGFFMSEEEIENHNTAGLEEYNEVRALVNSYVGAMKEFDKMDEIREHLAYTTSIVGLGKFDIKFNYDDQVNTREEFSKVFQIKGWNYIINKMDVRKFATSQTMEQVNKLVNNQQNIPFTEKNIYHLLDMIVQTRGQQFDNSLVSVIENYTKYTHENRYEVKGWKTNSESLLNKKIIIDGMCERGWGNADYVNINYGTKSDRFDDLVKVMCYLTGRNYSEVKKVQRENKFSYQMENFKQKVYPSIQQYGNEYLDEKGLDTGKWYNYGDLFEFKLFYKGTMHLKFKNIDDWAILNQRYGKIKGFNLPSRI